MRGDDIDLDDMLGLPPEDDATEILVDAAPKSRPMGAASRALVERSRSYPVNKVAKKNTPENLKRLLSYVAEMPVSSDAARRIGINYGTLKYWLQKSLEGRPGDGFDIVLGEGDETASEDDTMRFHEAWDLAKEVGMGLVERATIQRATGYFEPLTYQGRVKYKLDPDKMAIARLLGEPEDGPETYLLDQYGAPIPETVWKMDPDLAMFLLKSHFPTRYGNKASVDVSIRGGVLVIPMRAATPEALNVIEEEFRREDTPAVEFDEAEEDDDQ
jgi:hypothetical protein